MTEQHDEQQIKSERHANRRLRDRCQEHIRKSHLPKGVKDTLGRLLDYIGKKTHYRWAFISHAALARDLGISASTVERHLRAARKAKLLNVKLLGLQAARQELAPFGIKLRPFAHYLSLYSINVESPFWTGQYEPATSEVKALLPSRRMPATLTASNVSNVAGIECPQRCRTTL